MRRRALGAGLVAGALAVVGLVVLREDAYPVYHGLVSGAGLPALIVSVVAGVLDARAGVAAAASSRPA